MLGATAGKETDKTPFLDEVYILAFGGAGAGREDRTRDKNHMKYTPWQKDFKCYREIQSRERGQAKQAWEAEARTGAQLTLPVWSFSSVAHPLS